MYRTDAKGIVKHFELIKAFADGEEIEFLEVDGTWKLTSSPCFVTETQYRIKPKPLERHYAQDVKSKACYPFSSEEDAKKAVANWNSQMKSPRYRYVLMREVME